MTTPPWSVPRTAQTIPAGSLWYRERLRGPLQNIEAATDIQDETRALIMAVQELINLVTGEYIGRPMVQPALFLSIANSLNAHIQYLILPRTRWWRNLGQYVRFGSEDMSAQGDILRIDLYAFVRRLEHVSGTGSLLLVPANHPIKQRRPTSLGRLLPNPKGILDIDEIIASRVVGDPHISDHALARRMYRLRVARLNNASGPLGEIARGELADLLTETGANQHHAATAADNQGISSHHWIDWLHDTGKVSRIRG